jgi:hypothetical protein
LIHTICRERLKTSGVDECVELDLMRRRSGALGAGKLGAALDARRITPFSSEAAEQVSGVVEAA